MKPETRRALVTLGSGDPLRASALRAFFEEQEALTARHLAGVHGGWGIVSGLEARLHEGSPVEISVEPGAAVDALGRWITVNQRETVPAPQPRHEAEDQVDEWLLVIGRDMPPRFVHAGDAGPPGLSIVLARWNGRTLSLGDRRSARPRRVGVPPRMLSGLATKDLTAIERDDRDGWSARIDLEPDSLEAEVVAMAWPNGAAPAGACWSVASAHPGGFTIEAAHWPMIKDSTTNKPIRALPMEFHWILVETGHVAISEPAVSPDGVAPMSAKSRPAPASSSTSPSREFTLPSPPSFLPGSTLRAEQLNSAVKRNEAIHALHNRTMHPRGIVAGLTLSVEPDGITLRVQPGAAIDVDGLERTCDEALLVDPPFEAVTAVSVTRILVLASGADGTDTPLVWRDPRAKTGPMRLREGCDIVLATVEYAGGKAKIRSGARRDVRPPDVRAGITPERATEWTFWGDPAGTTPGGVSTFVNWPGGMESPGGHPVVLAQLVGNRFYKGKVLGGQTFVVVEDTAGGFRFVVAFPERGLQAWGVEYHAARARLLDDLRDLQNWRVSWIATDSAS